MEFFSSGKQKTNERHVRSKKMKKRAKYAMIEKISFFNHFHNALRRIVFPDDPVLMYFGPDFHYLNRRDKCLFSATLHTP